MSQPTPQEGIVSGKFVRSWLATSELIRFLGFPVGLLLSFCVEIFGGISMELPQILGVALAPQVVLLIVMFPCKARNRRLFEKIRTAVQTSAPALIEVPIPQRNYTSKSKPHALVGSDQGAASRLISAFERNLAAYSSGSPRLCSLSPRSGPGDETVLRFPRDSECVPGVDYMTHGLGQFAFDQLQFCWVHVVVRPDETSLWFVYAIALRSGWTYGVDVDRKGASFDDLERCVEGAWNKAVEQSSAFGKRIVPAAPIPDGQPSRKTRQREE